MAYEMLIKQITYIGGDMSLENVEGLIKIKGRSAQHPHNCRKNDKIDKV